MPTYLTHDFLNHRAAAGATLMNQLLTCLGRQRSKTMVETAHQPLAGGETKYPGQMAEDQVYSPFLGKAGESQPAIVSTLRPHACRCTRFFRNTL